MLSDVIDEEMQRIFAKTMKFENPYNLPQQPHGGQILHAWNMSFNEIINHLDEIAKAGFSMIQTSPIGASLEREPGKARHWYDLYQPTAFTIGNHLGTEAEFRKMTTAAAQVGIRVIVDTLPNHTTREWEQIDPFLRNHVPSLFHNRPDSDDPEHQLFNVGLDFFDRRSFVRSNLVHLWDFATGRPEFQQLYMEFLGKMIDAGASGFRYDAAHHVELPDDPADIASDFWPNIARFVNEEITKRGLEPFQYGEILGDGTRANHYLHHLYEDYRYLVTTDAFGKQLLRMMESGWLVDGPKGWDTDNFIVCGHPGDVKASFGRPAAPGPQLDGHEGFAAGVVPWVESHDTYGNEGHTKHLTDAEILTGWALIAARKDTTPLFFVRPGIGFTNSGNMFLLQSDGSHKNAWGHQKFYQDPAVAAINWFANDFRDEPERLSTQRELAIIERGNTGIVVVNINKKAVYLRLKVEVTDGTYHCRISHQDYLVEKGILTGPDVPAVSVLVLYKK